MIYIILVIKCSVAVVLEAPKTVANIPVST
jgi:hypothetical protein